MSDYQRILVAIDLTEEASEVLGRAKRLADTSGAQLELIHVVEPVGYAYGGDLPLDLSDLQQQLEDNATARLAEHGEAFGIGEANRRIVVGRPGSEIKKQAEALGADLIVMGSHGRHGIQLLLGSTANSVLHGTSCDVLAVRVKD
ncbi:universal stress protein A [Halospina denitrificans]|uniref:Universal stress protein n=1 Tax=Halospina denitrificans TaxID=332522 RepID=A0A4V3EQF1_9GAMM|nr:universal stress protein [Halospina denitrificans]TDT41618.1 universal stress protein A [Halospina denitrificans]